MNPEIEPLMSARELSATIKVGVNTLHVWRRRGEGPPAIKVGGSIRYRRADVERWLAEQVDERPARDA